MTVVLIPVRGFSTGKSRLGAAVDDETRQALVRSMAETALAAVSGLEAWVVTPDPEVAAWAAARGARAERDRGDDLNAVLEAARGDAFGEGASSVMVLFADLPSVTRADVEDLLALSGPEDVVLAPDRSGRGTNALHIGAQSRLVYRFGPGSFAAHLAQRPTARVVRRPGLADDVDDAASLRLARR